MTTQYTNADLMNMARAARMFVYETETEKAFQAFLNQMEAEEIVNAIIKSASNGYTEYKVLVTSKNAYAVIDKVKQHFPEIKYELSCKGPTSARFTWGQ